MVQRNSRRVSALVFTTVIGSGFIAAPAFAQSQQSPASEAASAVKDIIVTARRRNETAIDVPGTITAIGAADLARYNTRDFWGLQNQVPGLIIQEIPSSSGGAISLRGLSSSATNAATDQTVAINVDGVQVGSGTIIRLSQIDLAQIEVLKGPQALFFGKNSPAGVISIRSADPGDRLQMNGSLDYEFNAREGSAQIAVGGPITDTLGARVVVYGNKMRGWLKNNAQVFPGFSYGPSTRVGPNKEETFFRGTLVFKPSSEFTIRTKYNYSMLRSDSDIFDKAQRVACGLGTPQNNRFPGTIDCKMDDVTTNGRQDPRLIALLQPLLPPDLQFRGTGQKTSLKLASLEMNYEPVSDITLTSLTGYFKINDRFSGNAMFQNGGGLATDNPSERREISQEFRVVTAKADWPVNFAAGAYYQDTRTYNVNSTAIDRYALGVGTQPGVSCACSVPEFLVNGEAASVFGQVIAKPIDQIEIAGGLRYSKENKDVAAWLDGVPKTAAGTGFPFGVNRVKFTNTSPEITLRYRPNNQWTIFGAWRNGFKSGGFNTGSGSAVNAITRIDYRPEKVRGFEAGIKYADGRIRANIAAYTYKYNDLQVQTFDPNLLSQRIFNAAAANIKGIEADINWQTPLDGFELRASVNYNHNRYANFLAGCYTGQLVSEGCNTTPNALLVAAMAAPGFNPNGPFPAGAAYQTQNLKGRPLVLAPDWVGNAGLTYLRPVGSNLNMGMTVDVLYSSAFFGMLQNAPQSRQRQYANVDASLSIGAEDGRWKVSLMGRNLTEVYRARYVSQTPLTGIGTRTGTNNPGGLPDFSGYVNRGREIRLQFSFKFDDLGS